MNRTKKLASLLLALSLVFSMFAFSVNTFGAVETDLDDVSANAETAASGEDFVLHDTVEGSTILHAFCWSYDTIKENLPDIARAGFTAVQTSPVQQPKDVGTSNDISGQWSKMYQPLSFSIAKNSWIGTKAELQSLCEEADKYGIKIICDIVSNHLAQEADLDGVPAKDIADYEPEIYNNQDKYFHSLKGYTADTSLRNQVQGLCSKCPDLNTGDEYVQSRVISLLKECIDCGVDGFRFDAAKHIETPDDKIDDENDFSSDFWPNITSAAEEYYRDKTGSDLYMYGEVLGNPGSDSKTGFTRQITSYTKYIDITDSNYSKAIRESAGKGSASSISKVSYSFSDLEASDIVAWVESHDNYEGDGTESLSNDVITKAWAVIAARKDSTGLFFARPGAIMGDSGDTNWKSTAVCEINKFHNIFASVAEENVSSTGVVSVVERGSKGAVIVNFGVAGTVEADVTTLANGVYTDAVSGNLFTVSDGKVTGEVGKSGVAVIYEGAETTPRAFVNKESGSFKATSLSVDITLENAISGTYSIDGGTPVNFENSASVNLGAMSNPGDVITLTVTATNGSVTTENTYKYTKEKTTDSGIFIYFQNFKGYKTPYIYAYLEDGKGNVLSVNRNWPGEPMDYDEEKGLYYYEITEDIANNGKVIFSNAGSSQYPSQTAKDGGLLVENESMILTTGNKWQTLYNYTTVPLGDFDQNEKIEIADVTAIQKHMAKMAVKSSDRELTAGDVNGDGVISIKDGTAIQKYLCSITLPYKIGERVDVVSHSTTDSNSLFYVVDKTGWVFTYGANIWVCNEDTGEAMLTVKESPNDDSSKYATLELPDGWKNLSIYRLPFDAGEFDKTLATDSWTGIVYESKYNAYTLIGKDKGEIGVYDPNASSLMVPKTIYFDNTRAKWNEVYIYGWGESGLNSAFHKMTQIPGTEIWTFTFDEEFEAGSACIKFSAYSYWSTELKDSTDDIVTEAGKNYWVSAKVDPVKGYRTGSWKVYGQ